MSSDAGLRRFVDAQDEGNTYVRAIAELRQGRKQTHWMWFVFPQIAGLGRSAMAATYAIASLDEARDYLRHPVLGPRLVEAATVVVEAGDDAPATAASAQRLLGSSIDAVKLRSSMTLFREADPTQPLFQRVLDRYFDGEADPATLERIRS